MKLLLMTFLGFIILSSCSHRPATPKLLHRYSDRNVTVHLRKYNEGYFLVAKEEERKLLNAYAGALRDNVFLNKELDIISK